MAFPGWQASEDSIYRVAAEWLVLVKYGDACTTCGEQRAHRHGFRPRRRVAEQAGVAGDGRGGRQGVTVAGTEGVGRRRHWHCSQWPTYCVQKGVRALIVWGCHIMVLSEAFSIMTLPLNSFYLASKRFLLPKGMLLPQL